MQFFSLGEKNNAITNKLYKLRGKWPKAFKTYNSFRFWLEEIVIRDIIWACVGSMYILIIQKLGCSCGFLYFILGYVYILKNI